MIYIYNNSMAKTVDIIPITKWKRFLIYLGDASITFLLSIFLFVVAVYPIGKSVANYEEISEQIEQKNHLCDDLFFANNILFYEEESSKYDYENSLDFTYKKFLSVYVNNEAQTNDVIYNYFVTMKSDENKYKSLFNEKYFNVSSTITLKDSYKDPLTPVFNEHDELTEYGKTIYTEIQEKGFLMMYSEIIKDVGENDLSYNGISYLKTCEEVKELNTSINWSISIFAIIAYTLGALICYMVFPLISKNKTVLMSVLHYERIGIDNLYLLSKKEALLGFIYNYVFVMYTSLFIPLMLISVVGLFVIPLLLPLAVISFVFNIASFVVLLSSGFSRTLSDVLTKTVLVKAEELDKIYKSKGYIQN